MSPAVPQASVHADIIISAPTVFDPACNSSSTVSAAALQQYRYQLQRATGTAVDFTLDISLYLCLEYTRDTGTAQRTVLSQQQTEGDVTAVRLYVDETDNRIHCILNPNDTADSPIHLCSNTDVQYHVWTQLQLCYHRVDKQCVYTLVVDSVEHSRIESDLPFAFSNSAISIGRSLHGIIDSIALHTNVQSQHLRSPNQHKVHYPVDAPAQPIPTRTLPIRSVRQLADIKDTIYDPLNQSTVPYRPPADQPHKRQRVLHCHDYRGGYTDDSTTQSVAINSATMLAYNFTQWAYIDMFIYFSHERISIPTKAYIDQCHRHNVQCLGTFITEWEPGAAELRLLLSDETAWQMYADQLIRLAVYYGFDGYLINVESNLADTDDTATATDYVRRLEQFLRYLTHRIHAAIPCSQVLWYDGISYLSARIDWQSELNEHNIPFFDACDGIFLDYKWKDEQLNNTAIAAAHRNYDVYVGVDCWGRGTYGGGGFNTWRAMVVIQKHQLSVALFGYGWTNEAIASGAHGSRVFFELADNKLWRGANYKLHTITQYDTLLCSHQFEQQYDTSIGAMVSVASAEQCVRAVKYDLRQLLIDNEVAMTDSIMLQCVQPYRGTPPNNADPIRWTITLVDTNKDQLIDIFDSGSAVASSEWQTFGFKFNASELLAMHKAVELTWKTQCSDAEHWAGHFGTRLADGCVVIQTGATTPSIANYSQPRLPTLNESVPFRHSFNTGVGKRMYLRGDCVRRSAWFQLGIQDVQSVLAITSDTLVADGCSVDCSLTYDTAYNSGSCVAIRATIHKPNKVSHWISLFAFSRVISEAAEHHYRLSYVIKQPKALTLVCSMFDQLGRQLQSTDARVASKHNGWIAYETCVTVPAGSCCAAVKCLLTANTAHEDPFSSAAYIGQITISDFCTSAAVVNSSKLECTLVTSQWQLRSVTTGKDYYNAIISWTRVSSAYLYDVYHTSTHTKQDDIWLGRTSCNCFNVADYVDEPNRVNQLTKQYYAVNTWADGTAQLHIAELVAH